MFYVYKWFNIENGEIFYIGKGCRNRYKQTIERNKLFKEYYSSHNCDCEIIEYFDDENLAFKKEHELITKLKSIGQCFCNLDNGGKGGVNFIWTEDMRKYMSDNNPMKEQSQRERMSKNNPMYNEESHRKSCEKHLKMILYKGEILTSKQLAEKYNITIPTARNWAIRGYDTKGNPCCYNGINSPKQKISKTNKAIYIDGKYFKTIKLGAEYLGVKDASPLNKALKEKRTYKGHIVKYANQ